MIMKPKKLTFSEMLYPNLCLLFLSVSIVWGVEWGRWHSSPQSMIIWSGSRKLAVHDDGLVARGGLTLVKDCCLSDS